MVRAQHCLALLGLFALGACAVAPPVGPSIAAMPAKGKSLAAFQQDDLACRHYAAQQIGYGSPAEAAQQSAVNSAALGTVLGAAAGAAIGAAAGNPAAGAAIGAGSGLVMGTAAGAGAAQYSGASMQRVYDIAYAQCMASKGDSVPNMTAAVAPYYAASYPYAAYPAYPPFYAYPYPYYDPPAFVGMGWGWGWHHWHHWH